MALRKRCLFSKLTEADVVIFHCLPRELDSFFKAHPEVLSKNIIAYCYWEATDLPECLKYLISFAREVWTCSKYCKTVFEKYHPSVIHVPHIVARNITCSDESLVEIKRVISHAGSYTYFLTIASLGDRRKNVHLLIKEFHRLSSMMPGARLIVKTSPVDDNQQNIWDGNVIFISRQLTYEQINALYSLADVYVSVHHSEAWGLTLSDSILFRKPIIATGYSGNMEFMNSENSFPLDYKEEYIHAEDRVYLFNGNMKWAYPHVEHLDETLLWLYHHKGDPCIRNRVEKACTDIRGFNESAILEIMSARLGALHM